MPSLKYESAGMQIVFEQRPGAKFYIDFNDFDDNGAIGIFERYRISNLDGEFTGRTHLDSKNISFKFLYDKRQGNYSKIGLLIPHTEDLISEIFNPKEGGILTYRNDSGEERFIECRPKRTALITSRRLNTISYTVELTADEPYWKSKEETVEMLKVSNLLVNRCNQKIYPRIVFLSAGYICNETTGEKIEVIREIAENQKITYDCKTGKIEVLQKQNENWIDIYNDELIFKNLSNRLSILPGRNEFVATAEGTIKYNPIFLGVGSQ